MRALVTSLGSSMKMASTWPLSELWALGQAGTWAMYLAGTSSLSTFLKAAGMEPSTSAKVLGLASGRGLPACKHHASGCCGCAMMEALLAGSRTNTQSRNTQHDS